MPGKTIGLIVGIIIVVAVVVIMLTRPSAAPTNTTNTTNQTNNTNQTPTNTPGGDDRSFQTNTNPTITNPTTNTNTSPSSTIVTITSTGTNPRSPSIQAGTSVMFQNSDNVTHQISSNPHPAHTDLPGFDLLIPAGGSRTFTFTQTGNWGYHDHIFPFDSNLQGTINVR